MKKIGSLPSRAAFEATRKGGNVFDGRFLRFIYQYGSEHPPLIQTGIVVGKRHGRAVRRNLLRRRVREACRILAGFLVDNQRVFPPSLSLIIVYRGPTIRTGAEVSFDEIQRDVAKFADAVQGSRTGG